MLPGPGPAFSCRPFMFHLCIFMPGQSAGHHERLTWSPGAWLGAAYKNGGWNCVYRAAQGVCAVKSVFTLHCIIVGALAGNSAPIVSAPDSFPSSQAFFHGYQASHFPKDSVQKMLQLCCSWVGWWIRDMIVTMHICTKFTVSGARVPRRRGVRANKF